MKILQLCNKPPLPKIDGGCIAIYNISEGLLNTEHHLELLTIATHKHPFIREAYSNDFIERTKIEGIFIDTRVNIIDAFSALVTADSYNVSRFFSPDFDKKLAERLAENHFDIVQLESLFMTPYISTIRRNSDAKIVLRSHNLEHLIWERLADSAKNTAKKIYLKHLASKLKKYEKKILKDIDGIATISCEDTLRFTQLKCEKPMITIPFGINLDKYKITKHNKKSSSLFHLGAMNWAPNLEAINWFLDDIWPDVSQLDVQLHLAGREMPESFLKMNDGKLIIHESVEDAIQFMNDHDIMIVPLLSGSGMRVKIIEGMALGKIVITTTIGAEGIDFEPGKHLLIADTPQEFFHHIKHLTENKSYAESIAENARNLVAEKYDNHIITQKLISFYKDLIEVKN